MSKRNSWMLWDFFLQKKKLNENAPNKKHNLSCLHTFQHWRSLTATTGIFGPTKIVLSDAAERRMRMRTTCHALCTKSTKVLFVHNFKKKKLKFHALCTKSIQVLFVYIFKAAQSMNRNGRYNNNKNEHAVHSYAAGKGWIYCNAKNVQQWEC